MIIIIIKVLKNKNINRKLVKILSLPLFDGTLHLNTN